MILNLLRIHNMIREGRHFVQHGKAPGDFACHQLLIICGKKLKQLLSNLLFAVFGTGLVLKPLLKISLPTVLAVAKGPESDQKSEALALAVSAP